MFLTLGLPVFIELLNGKFTTYVAYICLWEVWNAVC